MSSVTETEIRKKFLLCVYSLVNICYLSAVVSFFLLFYFSSITNSFVSFLCALNSIKQNIKIPLKSHIWSQIQTYFRRVCWSQERARGVVAQYHRADKSATATSDPAPSPAGCRSDFPKLSAQLSAISVYCSLTLQQALRKPPLIHLQATFHYRRIKYEKMVMRCREFWEEII